MIEIRIDPRNLDQYQAMECDDCGMLNVVHKAYESGCRCAYCGGILFPVHNVTLQKVSFKDREECKGCFGASHDDCQNCDIIYNQIKESLERRAEKLMAEKKNSEGYQDPTAYGAERAVELEAKKEKMRKQAEHAEIEKRSNQLVGVMKLFADMAGFEIISRIHLRHKRTGKEFK